MLVLVLIFLAALLSLLAISALSSQPFKDTVTTTILVQVGINYNKSQVILFALFL